MTLEARAAESIRTLCPEDAVAVACSGGGDSIATLHLAVRALGAARVTALSVNHNLRPEAADEITLVARHCAALGVEHQVLEWHWSGVGNVQAAARGGRHSVLLAATSGTILMGHTADDQAETVLLRLARGSGVDGLAGIRPVSGRVIRPLLGETRADLRDWLRAEGLDWVDDPSNEDPRFDRIRARKMADALADLGLSRARLLQTAELMQDEADVLAYAALNWAKTHVRAEAGDLLIDASAVRAAPSALVSRILAAAVQWMSASPYKPRRQATQNWLDQATSQGSAPLGGVSMTVQGETLRLSRELHAANRCEKSSLSGLWDHRWQITGPAKAGALRIVALGDYLRDFPAWRTTGLPRRSLRSTPAIFVDDALVAAPLAGLTGDWDAFIPISFITFLESR